MRIQPAILLLLGSLAAAMLGAALMNGPAVPSDPFIHPQKASDPMIYGIRAGIALALYPDALNGWPKGGPRGLIRVGFEESGRFELANYIAVEPEAAGKKSFSELEQGRDGKPGLRFWVGKSLSDGGPDDEGDRRGQIIDTPDGRALQIVIHVEDALNGTKPEIEATLFEKFPDRVRFRTFVRPGSVVPSRFTLSATMGNKSRCRNLWLQSGALYAPELYKGRSGQFFFERPPYPLYDLHRTATGDIVAAITPDEFEPREVWPFPDETWRHSGGWRSMFWLKRPGTYGADLKCRVNGRQTYYRTTMPLPGGKAFENFEFRERFITGQESWFGISSESPSRQFGFSYEVRSSESCGLALDQKEQSAAALAERTHRPFLNGEFIDGIKGWSAEGDAFQRFQSGRMCGVTSLAAKKEAGRGRLFQCFEVPRDAVALEFWENGGTDRRSLFVGLWQDGVLRRTMTGRDDARPFRVCWDLRPLRGKVLTLEVRDEKTGPWGYLSAAHFSILNHAPWG